MMKKPDNEWELCFGCKGSGTEEDGSMCVECEGMKVLETCEWIEWLQYLHAREEVDRELWDASP